MGESRCDPLAGLGALQREINRLLEDFLGRRDPQSTPGGTYEPAVEVTDTPEALVVRLQVPGVTKDELQLTVTNDTLTIRGHVREAPEGNKVYQREFHYGPFSRTLTLPVPVQSERSSAQLKDGVLTITMPKRAQTPGHDIPIQT
jgi:HSP20 family protein